MGKVQSFLDCTPDENIKEFGMMLLAGKTYDEIAAAFKVSSRLVRMIRRQLNLPVKPVVKPMTPAQLRRIAYHKGVEERRAKRKEARTAKWTLNQSPRELRKLKRRARIHAILERGMSYGNIAKQLGVSRQYIQQIAAFTPDERASLMKIADNKCQGDNCKAANGKLDAHHTNYIKNEGMILCVSCHRKANALKHTRPRQKATR